MVSSTERNRSSKAGSGGKGAGNTDLGKPASPHTEATVMGSGENFPEGELRMETRGAPRTVRQGKTCGEGRDLKHTMILPEIATLFIQHFPPSVF